MFHIPENASIKDLLASLERFRSDLFVTTKLELADLAKSKNPFIQETLASQAPDAQPLPPKSPTDGIVDMYKDFKRLSVGLNGVYCNLDQIPTLAEFTSLLRAQFPRHADQIAMHYDQTTADIMFGVVTRFIEQSTQPLAFIAGLNKDGGKYRRLNIFEDRDNIYLISTETNFFIQEIIPDDEGRYATPHFPGEITTIRLLTPNRFQLNSSSITTARGNTVLHHAIMQNAIDLTTLTQRDAKSQAENGVLHLISFLKNNERNLPLEIRYEMLDILRNIISAIKKHPEEPTILLALGQIINILTRQPDQIEILHQSVLDILDDRFTDAHHTAPGQAVARCSR